MTSRNEMSEMKTRHWMGLVKDKKNQLAGLKTRNGKLSKIRHKGQAFGIAVQTTAELPASHALRTGFQYSL